MTTRRLWTILAAFTALSVFVVASGSAATASSPADTAVRSLEEAGILAGTNCSSEDSDGDLLRWEAAFWLAKALDLGPARTVGSEDVPAGGDPDGEISYALLPDGTLFGHRHDHGDAKCWMWAPPDDNGNASLPQDAQPPSHTR